MKNCSIVIGSLFGDEGKGHMTDICANRPSTINVRFNGGAQASHTVVTPDGKRHAFRHFGSGTFTGSVTYLSEDFIVNTVMFDQERRELFNKFNIVPYTYVNPNCIVTTLWDIYINQGIEAMRGENRHGSCGMGINETVERSRYESYRITVMDLVSIAKLRKKLENIYEEYVPMRLENEYHITINDLPKKYRDRITDKRNIEIFMFYAKEFISKIQIMNDSILNRYDNVVFEGAQGLLLDQNNMDFYPHTTTSNTGIKNVMKILNRLDFKGNTDIYYMTRCYMTRHGAGPFGTEMVNKPYKKIEDLTNIPNEFQGTIRFGILDLDLLSEAINEDLKNLKVEANIYVTFSCFDQLDEVAKYVSNGKFVDVNKTQFLSDVSSILDMNLKQLNGGYSTTGLTRNELVLVKN